MSFTYQQALEFLNTLQSKGIRPGLKNIALALARFGNPQFQFPAVHIGGTNGKGSTAAITANILKTAGYKVGLFTSPHLHSVRERIQINSQHISQADFASMVKEIKDGLSIDLTYFEFLTLMAFFYFAQNKVDIGVIEVGLGGRLDATNLLLPKVTIVTNVHLDHQHWLGRSLKSIALEKGGIIKYNTPFITGVKQKDLISLLKKICKLKNASFYQIGADIRYRRGKHGFSYFGLKRHLSHLKLGLKGEYQIKNATLGLGAIEVLEKVGFTVKDKHIQKGLKSVSWPGRFEVITSSPKVILDVAHNPAGAMALKKNLSSYNKNLVLVLGIMQDKNIKKIMKILAPLAQIVIVTSPQTPRAAKAELLSNIAKNYCSHIKIIPSVSQAITTALSIATPNDLVLVTGSLYTVAEAREALRLRCLGK
ncbi:MAG TPA: bifunctional folylpolyglutamate synthase/dihydrofolate synthase [Candidatus Desulfofervidus auxilii]|uniref:Dihydrofolate synthase/folylpolyglutamate synthase n=1 Tax=Desulfofervidus auxilii TaxID=1621989 RepID=A0A7C1VP30_DESA2|nr:bifunctional folylpolyglutamate synthase/dihydrofolate synthase [Candidatus Desulfofervidus auxilii]